MQDGQPGRPSDRYRHGYLPDDLDSLAQSPRAQSVADISAQCRVRYSQIGNGGIPATFAPGNASCSRLTRMRRPYDERPSPYHAHMEST
eukprot:scaffold5363_cov400-Prasinococcus_capsulatus_cf.AAC.2